MKKIVIGIFIIIVIIITGYVVYTNINREMTDEMKIRKGYKLFGNEECKGHNVNDYSTLGLVHSYKCLICGIKYGSDTWTKDPVICGTCAKITTRCRLDGKLVKESK